jgi:hypothetical protein
MVSQYLNFLPPSAPNIDALLIYEGPTSAGPFALIETTTNVGSPPNYITEYTTDNATSHTNYFVIQWRDDDGNLGEPSAPIKGNTQTVVAEVVERVLLRSPNLDERIVVQEAEAIIEYVFNKNPYEVSIDEVTYTQLAAMTDLALVYSTFTTQTIAQASTSSVASYTAGLVSEKSGDVTQSGSAQSGFGNLTDLEERAWKRLNVRGISRIGQLAPLGLDALIGIGCPTASLLDVSRLLATHVKVVLNECEIA